MMTRVSVGPSKMVREKTAASSVSPFLVHCSGRIARTAAHATAHPCAAAGFPDACALSGTAGVRCPCLNCSSITVGDLGPLDTTAQSYRTSHPGAAIVGSEVGSEVGHLTPA